LPNSVSRTLVPRIATLRRSSWSAQLMKRPSTTSLFSMMSLSGRQLLTVKLPDCCPRRTTAGPTSARALVSWTGIVRSTSR
jgi:hypothetical protein